MRRLHLIELEDQSWFPTSIRDAMTDFLSFVAGLSDLPFRAMSAKIRDAMIAAETRTLVELGAGGGGPAIKVASLLKAQGMSDVRVVLTDLYPNVARLRQAAAQAPVPCDIVETSIDATAMPAQVHGLRFLSNIFHHLPEDAARKCLADAVACRQPIAIMELVSRSAGGVLQVLVAVLSLCLFTPIIRPFRVSRIVFTYLIPVIPLATLWDGLVSCLRVYSPKEMDVLIESLPRHDFVWDTGRLPVGKTGLSITYLVGVPRARKEGR